MAARGHWVGGTDLRDVGDGLDAFQQVCPVQSEGYLDELTRLVRAWSVDLVIPSISEELPLLAVGRRHVPAPVLVSSASAVRIADDKLLTARRLHQAGVPAPQTDLPSSFRSLAHAVATLGGAVIVKPRVSRGGRGVRIFDAEGAEAAEAVEAWRSLDDSFVVQEFAPGTEYAPVLLRERDATVRACVPLRKTALKDGAVGNAVSVVRADGSDDVRAVAVAAADALDLTGPADIDVRRRADGVPVVLEVNARFGANSAAAPELLDAVIETCPQNARSAAPTRS
ncbi:MAG TPA: ATP-grasp domain-containing protein [Arachnia sp.]|nr:ATP-grasp domain-containing protein [Arachnia sp.]HMR12792.1 ATP-grasp domain-containing protein [Arachnia sp.]